MWSRAMTDSGPRCCALSRRSRTSTQTRQRPSATRLVGPSRCLPSTACTPAARRDRWLRWRPTTTGEARRHNSGFRRHERSREASCACFRWCPVVAGSARRDFVGRRRRPDYGHDDVGQRGQSSRRCTRRPPRGATPADAPPCATQHTRDASGAKRARRKRGGARRAVIGPMQVRKHMRTSGKTPTDEGLGSALVRTFIQPAGTHDWHSPTSRDIVATLRRARGSAPGRGGIPYTGWRYAGGRARVWCSR